MIKILYISGTYAKNAWSGGELSAHTLLKRWKFLGLAESNVVCEKLCDDEPDTEDYEGIFVRRITHKDFEAKLENIISTQKIDYTFTQPYWHSSALKLANKWNIKSILRVPNIPVHINLTLGSAFAPSVIIAQTTETRSWIQNTFGRQSILAPAFIDLERARVDDERESPRKYITMFNPVKEKGGYIFKQLVELLPDYDFAYVPGWTSHRDSSGAFDKHIFSSSAESEGLEYDGWLPDEPTLDQPNVTLLHPRDNVSEIYATTRLLLVPSQWDEQFARVIYEAASNRIPVIASQIAGIAEHSAHCALLVPDYKNASSWSDFIKRFDSLEYAQACGRQAYNWVSENYNLDAIASQVFSEIIKQHAQSTL